jgi:hypothetical protein
MIMRVTTNIDTTSSKRHLSGIARLTTSWNYHTFNTIMSILHHENTNYNALDDDRP